MFERIEQHIVALVAGTAAAARRVGAVVRRGETVGAAAAIGMIALLAAAMVAPMSARPRCERQGRYESYHGYQNVAGQDRYEAGRRCGRRRSSHANVRRLTGALLAYARNNEGRLPSMNDAATVKAALDPYVKNERIWFHPRTGEMYQPNPALSYRKLDDIANPHEVVAFFSPRPDRKGRRVVGFLDGRVWRLSEESWPALRQASLVPSDR